jgi:uncharacterized protein YgiM (DUF1202 family)
MDAIINKSILREYFMLSRIVIQLMCIVAISITVSNPAFSETNSGIKCAGKKVPMVLRGKVIGSFTPFTKCGSITYFVKEEISRKEFINIRQEPSSKSPVVGHMRAGEVETPRFFESSGFITLRDGSRWIKGTTVGVYAEGTQGWVHDSQLTYMD